MHAVQLCEALKLLTGWTEKEYWEWCCTTEVYITDEENFASQLLRSTLPWPPMANMLLWAQLLTDCTVSKTPQTYTPRR